MVARAVPSRKAEFAGGRAAARAALAKLGEMPLPIPVGEGRAPVWPKGFVGSITHTADMCLAMVGHDKTFQSLGIDLDLDRPLPADIISEVVLTAELRAAGDPEQVARRIFSAKEALFKAQFPQSHAFIGFHAMQCDLHHGRAIFTDHAENVAIPTALRARGLPIRQWRSGGLILSVSAPLIHY